MRTLRLALLSALLLFLLPASAQDEGRWVHFSLGSDRTFGTGEKPVVHFWGHGLREVQFRVYRVKDPVAFLERLGGEHHMAGEPVRPPRKLTLIEQFHAWKRSLRNSLRDFARAQFDADTRAMIHRWLEPEGKKAAARPRVARYANVPLLNSQQVVAVWRQPLSATGYWASQNVEIPITDHGLYVVEATDGRLQAYTIVSLTKIAVVTKAFPGRLMARVVDRASGAPIPNCQLILWSQKAEIARLRSNADGLADMPLPKAKGETVLVMASADAEFAAVSVYGWNLNASQGQSLTGYVYTDRPVYRPGHTAYFRAIIRARAAMGYELPQTKEAAVSISDPDGKAVFRRTLPISSMGSLNGELALEQTAALGYYSIEIDAGGGSVRGGFHVEEYKKPEYEVRVTPRERRVLLGGSNQVTIQARYYYGEPVAKAKVTYVVHRARYWQPYYGEEEGEEEGEGEGEEDRFYGNEQVSEESAELDTQGKLVVEIPTADDKYDQVYRVEARVTDAGGREISGSNFFLATVANYTIRIDPEKYVYDVNEREAFLIETRDYEGKPVSGINFSVVATQSGQSNQILERAEGRTDSRGHARIELPGHSGSLHVTVTSRSSEGRDVEDTTWVWVTGGGSIWAGEGQQRIQIVPDKKSYKPGNVAHILIVTGLPHADLWVTVEGQTVYFSRVISASRPTVTIDVPIRPEYAPNVFVNAVCLHDHQALRGSKSIKVPATGQRLQVELKSSKPTYRPGDQGFYTIRARDSRGKPVSAEFSLGVVDEAIYAIQRESLPEILSFFYGRSYNRVNTDSSLSYYFNGEAGKRRMMLSAVRPHNALGQIKPERLVEPKVRKAFPDTMYWSPDLKTDSSGRVKVNVTFPDALTMWRATARGATADTKVGSAVQRTIVRKELILRLAVPRFFTEGDEVTLSAIVENYLHQEKTVRVSLSLQGLELVEGATRDIVVASRGQGQADFRVRAKAPGNAVILGKALTDKESDAVELTLPIKPYGVHLTEARGGALGSGQTQTQATLAAPAGADPASRSLFISASPSLAGAILGALNYLTSFPYGCTEQTMSSFLPNVVVAQAMKQLNLKSDVNPAELTKKIRAGLDRLYDYQHEDGGWGWWKTDESHPFMTAYVVSGLAQAHDAGYEVREDSLKRGTEWLVKNRAGMKAADVQAFALYALSLAGKLKPPAIDSLWKRKAELTSYGLALLGLAADRVHDPHANEIANLLEGAAKGDDLETYWPATRDALLDIDADATPEATAYALKLLARLRPESPLVPKAALYLVDHRSEGYYWSSTKQTAMVIYGLTDFLAHSGELHPDYSFSIRVNGKEVLTRRFTGADALAPKPLSIALPADQLGAGASVIDVSKSGEGRLYWSAQLSYFSATAPPRTPDTPLLARDYFKLTPTQQGSRIVYRLDPVSGPVQRGDVLAVRLTLSGNPWRYVLIEDPIPAGTEFIERDDLYELAAKPDWWESWYTRREFHDDRAAFFQTYFSRWRVRYVYLLKVVNPGQFRISPARAQSMYQPSRLTATDGRSLEVR